MTEPRPRRVRGALGSAVLALTFGAVVLVWFNAVLLGQMVGEVAAAQTRMTSLAKSGREILVLELAVTNLGTGSTPDDLLTQYGLFDRQLTVSITAQDPGSPQARELTAIHNRLSSYDWAGLAASGGRDPRRRQQAIDVVTANERGINELRNDAEQQFYLATIASLNAKQRGQIGLTALVAAVLTLGVVGVQIVTRRSQTRTERAYEQLKGEVAEREAAQEALRASEGRYRSLVQRASDLTVVTDDAGTITYASPAAERLLGYPAADLVDGSLLDHVEPDQRAAVAAATEGLAPGTSETIELRLRTRDAAVRSVEAVCQNLVEEPDVGGLVWNGRDVTDRRALENILTHQARHDALTGLPNRVLLVERLDAEVGTGAASVVLVDLDDFKHVNDTLGHPAGDEMLRVAAHRLTDCLGSGGTAARLGGDEFAILLPGRAPEDVEAVGNRLTEVLAKPYTVAGREVRIGASIGIAHCVGGRCSADDLLRDADIAMYAAKNRGKGRTAVFEPEMRDRASYRNSLQQAVARAVERGEIDVYYQPIVDLKTFRPVAMEALARWRLPDRSLIPMDMFIPVAEETGAIVEIGRAVLGAACRAAQLWRQTIPDAADLGISVNVSMSQVLSGRLTDHVREALSASGLPAAALTLEITESAALESAERVAAEFGRLREFGVRIAVDDFGAGYSSLGFMMGIEADVLKIDRSLLEFDTSRPGSLVSAVVELGHNLGLMVVVEGVETADHLARALEASSDAAQGYHFARPLPMPQAREWLSSL